MITFVLASLLVVLLIVTVLIWALKALTDGAIQAAEDMSGFELGDLGVGEPSLFSEETSSDHVKDGLMLACLFIWMSFWAALGWALRKTRLLRP